jgi:hypothetical protein
MIDPRVGALIEAMDQILDDMGREGQSVALASKAQARIAFEPFLDPESRAVYMPLDEAEKIWREVNR